MPAEFDAGFRYVTKNTELVVLNDETSSSAKKKKGLPPTAPVAVFMAPNIS